MNVRQNVSAYWQEVGIALFLFAWTLCLYLYRLTEITPGMWGDEVGLGWMVQDVVSHHSFTPFLPFNYGHPTLLVYLSAFFITPLGRNIFSLRLTSVLFGAASVGVFYLFSRLYFRRSLALTSALLLATSYVLIIVSRFAYEMSAGIFFFIAAGIGTTLLAKYRTKFSAFLIGVSLSFGLYTYLAFRLIVPILLIVTCILILIKKSGKVPLLFVLFVTFVLICLPLFTYGISHPRDINARTIALSVFNQHLPGSEVIKELQGASFRTLTMFGFTQDPNLRQNPGAMPPFELITSILFFSGLMYLWMKKRYLAAILTILTICILAGDIITLERIPDFHYYGLGHPNTLRISLLVPIVIFTASWVLNFLVERFSKWHIILLVSAVGIIGGINCITYYNQPLNRWIYLTNFVVPLKIIDTLNAKRPKEVALSPSLYDLQHVKYFLNPAIHRIKITTFNCNTKSLSYALSIVLAQDLAACSQQQLKTLLTDSSLHNIILRSPWNNIDGVIFTR